MLHRKFIQVVIHFSEKSYILYDLSCNHILFLVYVSHVQDLIISFFLVVLFTLCNTKQRTGHELSKNQTFFLLRHYFFSQCTKCMGI